MRGIDFDLSSYSTPRSQELKPLKKMRGASRFVRLVRTRDSTYEAADRGGSGVKGIYLVGRKNGNNTPSSNVCRRQGGDIFHLVVRSPKWLEAW